MTMGKTNTSVLTDIANAIRYQAGTNALFKPSEMAAAITALDGSNAGRYEAQEYKELESGVLSDAIYTDIADAVRAQNGTTEPYAPGELAAAILALTWEAELKPRALLLADGTLEFNYLDTRRSTLGGQIVATYDVPGAALSSASSQPWYPGRASVTRVAFDPSFAAVGVADGSYWFANLPNLVEVTGFEVMSSMTKATQMFTGCSALESIYATRFDNGITSGSMMFYGCKCLVGGADGFVPANTSGPAVCKLGAGGVLTDPAADAREWCRVFLYADGTVVFTRTGDIDPARTLRAAGRMCVSAKYNASGVIPGYASRSQMARVEFATDMAGFRYINMDYWFYGLNAITEFAGIANLAGVREMQFAFASCAGVTELDFRGFDPSSLTNLYMAFGSCGNLATIRADASWALPASGVSGTQTFYGCSKLVGGNGTAYANNRTGYAYFVVDREGQVGYLTAG